MKINEVVEIDENAIVRQMQKVKEAGDKFTDEILKLRGMMNVETPELERERRSTEMSLLINESVNEWCQNYQDKMNGASKTGGKNNDDKGAGKTSDSKD